MATLHIEHAITDLATWQRPSTGSRTGRVAAGVVAQRIHQPVDDDRYVVVQLDFPTRRQARRSAGSSRPRSGPPRPTRRGWQGARGAVVLAAVVVDQLARRVSEAVADPSGHNGAVAGKGCGRRATCWCTCVGRVTTPTATTPTPWTSQSLPRWPG